MTIKYILASLACIGSSMMFQSANFTLMNMAKIDTTVAVGFYAMVVGVSLQQVAVWIIPPFVVRVLMKYFQNETMKTNDTIEKCKTSLVLFESLTNCFSCFFVLYFLILQLFSIFVTYLFLSSIPNFTLNLYRILNLIGFILQLSCNSVWLISLTNSIDKCSECIKSLRRELEETLLCTQQKERRQYLKYLIRRIRDLKPMHARGYFLVDRSTLTSMLSVR